MTNEEILKFIALIIDYEGLVMHPYYKQKDEVSYKVAEEVHQILLNMLDEVIGDPVLARKLLDEAIFMPDDKMLQEIEASKKIAG